MYLILALQNTAQTTARTVPVEKQPALLSIVYMAGLALMVLLLLISVVRNMRYRRSALAAIAPADLPDEVRRRLGSTSTNRGLRALRWLFVMMALAVFGFHIYWALYAAEQNERLQQLSYKDQRNLRLSASTLRGWILDRSGTLDNALAYYKKEGDQIRREYPLDAAMAHLIGTDRGDPGLDRALFTVQSGNVPEALELVLGQYNPLTANKDVKLTIDRELQLEAVAQLKKTGKHGAVVMLNPQTGEVLAIYSEPSYSIKDIKDETDYLRLKADKRNDPLVNRALGGYYIPGSTFKTMVMIAAHLAGEQSSQFTCTGGGYVVYSGAKPILDDGGAGEVHGTIGINTAYEVSCNQYFAQMAVKLGPERMKQAAKLLGVGAYDTPREAVRGRKQPEIWNASTEAIKRAIAPREATMVTGPYGNSFNKFDMALQGYGQGYVGQMTPFQMALFAATIANMNGDLMKPKIELDRPPELFNHVVSAQDAAAMRAIMGLVTGGAHGTARGVFGPVKAAGIVTGGKTGTAQKDVPVYDRETGEPKTVIKYRKDNKGNIVGQYTQIVVAPEPRIDGWFLCIAPLDHPVIAMAVIIEGGGYGSRSAAPVAAAMILKAKALGYFGNAAKAKQEPETNKRRR